MAPPNYPNTRARANWAVERATSLPEVWAFVAMHLGVVRAWQLMRVCRASRAGATEYLRTLPGLVVCGGITSEAKVVSDAWRLDLATLRWEPVTALVTVRGEHACCAVRGALVVLGGSTAGQVITPSVEMLSSSEEEGGAFVDLPPLSCGGMYGAVAIAEEESDSAAGQVLLLGGSDEDDVLLMTVQLVDLATGASAPQNNLLQPRYLPAASRLPDGRIVCAGGIGDDESSAEVWGAPDQGGVDAAWIWTELPAMSAGRYGCCGCVMSDGRFAVLGGWNPNPGELLSSCETLVFDGNTHWEPLAPMQDARHQFACGSVAGCVIVAGGLGLKSAEVYDEELDRWMRLPCDLPYVGGIWGMGSALL
jgi:hypothetical protein